MHYPEEFPTMPMMIKNFRTPKSAAQLQQMIRLFLDDAFPSNCVNTGDNDESFQIDFPPWPSRNTYFITCESSEQYARRLRPEAWAEKDRERAAKQAGANQGDDDAPEAASPEPEPETAAEANPVEESESEDERLDRLSVHRFADRLARWVEDYSAGSFEVQAFPRSRSFILEAPMVDDDGDETEGCVDVRVSVQEHDSRTTDVAEQADLRMENFLLREELNKLRGQAKSA
jgi:hypothetical protein